MEVMINLIGLIMVDSMKKKFILVSIVFSITLTGCLERNDKNIDGLSIVKNAPYLKGETFSTMGVDNDSKTLFCIESTNRMEEVAIIDNSSFESTKIIAADALHDKKYLNLCEDNFDINIYNNVVIVEDAYEYSTTGYILDAKNIDFMHDEIGGVALDINKDGNADYIETCSSMESEHLNVWDNKGKNTRLMYAYRHIDADLIETCGDIDYPEDS